MLTVRVYNGKTTFQVIIRPYQSVEAIVVQGRNPEDDHAAKSLRPWQDKAYRAW